MDNVNQVSNEFKLFTLHFPNQKGRRSVASFLAKKPEEVAGRVGAEFVPREGGKCMSSMNSLELGMCGVICIDACMFHEMDETEEALTANMVGDVCFSSHGLNLVAKRGESIYLYIREEYIDLPEGLETKQDAFFKHAVMQDAFWDVKLMS